MTRNRIAIIFITLLVAGRALSCEVELKAFSHFVSIEKSPYKMKISADGSCSNGTVYHSKLRNVNVQIAKEEKIIADMDYRKGLYDVYSHRFIFSKKMNQKISLCGKSLDLFEINLKEKAIKAPKGFYIDLTNSNGCKES